MRLDFLDGVYLRNVVYDLRATRITTPSKVHLSVEFQSLIGAFEVLSVHLDVLALLAIALALHTCTLPYLHTCILARASLVANIARDVFRPNTRSAGGWKANASDATECRVHHFCGLECDQFQRVPQ